MAQVKEKTLRFCLECRNFEDRKDIEGIALCARNNYPSTSCPDFDDKLEDVRQIGQNTRFCLECKNFEDRTDIEGEGATLCAKNHRPGIFCQEFNDRFTDILLCHWCNRWMCGCVCLPQRSVWRRKSNCF